MSEPPGQPEPTAQDIILTQEAAIELIADRAIRAAGTCDRRVVVGIAGGPGSGKSTLAAEIIGKINQRIDGGAARVPMDGFHIRQAELEEMGLADKKGAPETFEPRAFTAFLRSLKTTTKAMSVPSYSRRIEDVVEDAFCIAASVPILVVEGNYLLLESPAWRAIRTLLDIAFYIEVPRDLVRKRLLKRHAEHGLFSAERNISHVDNIDLANYDLVHASKHRADICIRLDTTT